MSSQFVKIIPFDESIINNTIQEYTGCRVIGIFPVFEYTGVQTILGTSGWSRCAILFEKIDQH